MYAEFVYSPRLHPILGWWLPCVEVHANFYDDDFPYGLPF